MNERRKPGPRTPAPVTGSFFEGSDSRGPAKDGPVEPEAVAESLRFEDALARLESLVDDLESGELPLEETIEKFEEGQRLLETCNALLARAELRVKEILRGAEGGVVEQEWTGEDGADGE